MNAIPNITPINDSRDPAPLSDIAAQIVELMRQRAELSEQIRASYQEAADLGAPKAGFKLAVAYSGLAPEKQEDLWRGYKAGAAALNLQLDLFGA